MTSMAAKGLISHPTFNKSIESHGSAHSADTSYNGWRGESTTGIEDAGTQTDCTSTTGNATSGARTMFGGERRRRGEDAIVDISLETMKYNGGNEQCLSRGGRETYRRSSETSMESEERLHFIPMRKASGVEFEMYQR